MDTLLSNSTLLFRTPLLPVRAVTSTSKLNFSSIAFTSSNDTTHHFFTSQTKIKLSSTSPKFTCAASGGITEISQSEFPNTVLKSDRPVLVEFVANWCGPCRLIAPAIQWVAQEYGDRLMVVKIDHDANPQLIEQYKVYGLPTLILFKSGQEVPESRREGAITKAKLKEYLDPLLESISVA
ncbi:thioredoxin X, chloroplastic [Pistacia vera]|uniref:Uncharacterized protein n=2 Tax=Pistacia TaxID=55512 RepID=A0ACC1B7X1_9ROSI|nr:thioredoxin X, chloroplastic [Pistacia vera]KAJ0038716.1 hypothetical protein Pint_23215 [Pistacia integerrima]KAJ0095049.1 hypothetical protein Patl1_16390 [Pistacia atlantica]